MRPELDAVLTEWAGALARWRRPWPEWSRLEEQVACGPWELVEAYRGPSLSAWHLVRPGPGPRPWRLIPGPAELAEREAALTAWPEAYPAWLRPLVGLGHSEPNHAGALADAVQAAPIDAAWVAANGAYLGLAPPDEVCLAGPPLLPLQATAHGPPLFFCDAAGDVRLFSGAGGRFEAVGRIEAFVRYCLFAHLEGRSWHRDYAADRGLAAFGLAAVVAPGD